MRKVIVLFLIMAIQIFGIAVTKLSANNDEGVVVPIEKSEEEGEEKIQGFSTILLLFVFILVMHLLFYSTIHLRT